MAELTKSDHGPDASSSPTTSNGPRESLSFLSPNDALTTVASHLSTGTTSSTHAGRSGSNTANSHSNSLLPSPIPPPSASSQSSQHRPHSRVSVVSGVSRDDQSERAGVRKSHSQSVSSTPRTLASSKTSSTAADNRERQRAARSLPPWVQSADEDEVAVIALGAQGLGAAGAG